MVRGSCNIVQGLVLWLSPAQLGSPTMVTDLAMVGSNAVFPQIDALPCTQTQLMV